METKIVQFSDGQKVILGIEDGQIISQFYDGDRQPDPEPTPRVSVKDAKDLISLSAALEAKGLKRGTPEYDSEYLRLKGDLPLEAHPGFKDVR